MQRLLALCAVLLIFTGFSPAAHADAKTDQRLNDARKVFESFSNLTEQSIPNWMLERAYGIVVVPSVVKVALSIGGRGAWPHQSRASRNARDCQLVFAWHDEWLERHARSIV